MNNKALIICTGFLISSLLLGGWAFTASDYDNDSYVQDEQFINEDLSGINEVIIRNVNGWINCQIGAGDVLDMHVEERVKENRKIDAAALLSEARVVSRRSGDSLIVEIDYGRFEDSKHKGYYQSNYTIKLPQRLNVSLVSVNGEIEAPLFDGNVSLTTVNGGITTGGAGGEADLTTVNGGITIDSAGGNVKAATVNGAIKLKRIGGGVEAETVNGDIAIELQGALSGNVSVESVNGNIHFSPGAGSGYTVEADTHNGKVHGVDGLKTNRRHTYASGSVGDGRYTVKIDTFNGDIIMKR